MRYFSLIVVGFLIFCAACGKNPLSSSNETAVAPMTLMTQNGVSLQVAGVEASGEIIKLNLKAINGSEDQISLGDSYDVPVLRDNLGNEYPTKGENLSLQPLTVNDLQIEFLGKPASGAKTFSLTINPKSASRSLAPRLVLENIPVSTSGKISFNAATNPSNLNLNDKSVNHPNGTSFTINQVNFGENMIEANFLAVNGSRSDIRFSTRNNSAFLQDDKSNRYYLIPSTSGDEMKISVQEKMSGTLRFAGKIAPDAAKLSLHLNENGTNSDSTTTPKIVVSDIQINR